MDQKSNMQEIPIGEIFADEEWNSRNKINPMTCIELARSIKKDGLLQPIMVEPYSNPQKPDKKWKVILGHRRYVAMTMNKAESIPCVIRRDFDELTAFTANVQENLNRENLNLMEEGGIVGTYIARGMNRAEIAQELNKSEGWVQSRTVMFNLPVEVQKEIVVNDIPISVVKEIYTTYKSKSLDETYAHVRAVKEGRKNPLKNTKKPRKKDAKRSRSRTEIQEMMNHIREEGAGPCILTRLLAWCNGNITDGDIDLDLYKWHKEEQLEYTPLFDDGTDNYS